MNVILEGPDNAGKTSLANYLQENVLGLTYYHPGGRPVGDMAEDIFMHMQEGLAAHRNRYVLDRITSISQQVYNPDEVRDPIRRERAATIVSLQNVVLIYCRPPNESLMDVGNFKWRPEETEEHRQKIMRDQHTFVDRYDRIIQGTPCLFYNWQDEANANLIKFKLVQALKDVKSAVTWFQQLVHYRSAP